MRALDTHALTLFCAVARCLNFRQAAEQLHMTQPPLSRAIKALEERLGARLFERDTQGVALTPAGRQALARAQALLGEAQALAGLFADPARAPGRLRIGITAAVTVADRTRLARAWQRALPGTALALEAGFSRDLIPALKEGRLAFALVGLPGDVTGLETRPVQSSPLGAALPASHRLARRRVVSLLEVTDLPLFWIPRTHNPAYHDFCVRYFRRIGYRPETIIVEPGQLQTLERIAQGEGWTIPNGATLETKVRGVAYRALAEGEDLAVRVIAAWRAEGADARCARLAAVAARVLGSGAPTRPRAGRTA